MRRLPWLIPVLLLTLPAAGTAVERGEREITVGAGASFPTGDFGDLASSGFNLGGGFAYYLGSHFAVGGDLSYHDFDSDLEDAELSLVQATGLAKYVFGREDANGAPYLKANLGFYFPNFSYTVEVPGFGEEEVGDTDTEIGFGIGGGYQLQFRDSDWGIYGEAMYHTAGDAEYVDVRVGATILWGDLEDAL